MVMRNDKKPVCDRCGIKPEICGSLPCLRRLWSTPDRRSTMKPFCGDMNCVEFDNDLDTWICTRECKK